MTIFDKIETAISNYTDNPRGKHIAALFTAAALGAAGALGSYAATENLIDNGKPSEALIQNCIKGKEESMRTIMAPTPITLGPAFMEQARADCSADKDLREKSIQDDMTYRSYNLMTGLGLTVATLGALGGIAGIALRAGRALKR